MPENVIILVQQYIAINIVNVCSRVQVSYKYISGMPVPEVCFKHVSSMINAFFKHDTSMLQAYLKYGSSMN